MDTEHNIPSSLIMKDLKDVMAVFKKFNVKAFLAYGAVLGAVRSGDFIPWDDDIDIDVIDTCDIQTRKAIGGMLADLGFKFQPISFNVFGRQELTAVNGSGGCAYDGDGETGIIVCERNFKFSIFFYKEVGEEYVCIPKVNALPLISNLKKFYNKPDYVKLHGEKFLTPAPLRDYLTYMYGDWKKPVRDKHAPQFPDRHK